MPTPQKTGATSPLVLRLASPFPKISKETLGILYPWSQPFVVDDSAFRQAYGPLVYAPLDNAVRSAVDWYRTH